MTKRWWHDETFRLSVYRVNEFFDSLSTLMLVWSADPTREPVEMPVTSHWRETQRSISSHRKDWSNKRLVNNTRQTVEQVKSWIKKMYIKRLMNSLCRNVSIFIEKSCTVQTSVGCWQIFKRRCIRKVFNCIVMIRTTLVWKESQH